MYRPTFLKYCSFLSVGKVKVKVKEPGYRITVAIRSAIPV
jgi:hypothetical protein